MDKKAKKELYAENVAASVTKASKDVQVDEITHESTLYECFDQYLALMEKSNSGREMSESLKKKLEHTEVFISELPDEPFFPTKRPSYIAERLAQFDGKRLM